MEEGGGRRGGTEELRGGRGGKVRQTSRYVSLNTMHVLQLD